MPSPLPVCFDLIMAYFCYNFMYRLQNVFMKLKRAKLIRLEETVTMLQSTCFVKDVQLIVWYLFTQNKSWVFLTYINIKLYIKQNLIFQISTREILVFLYYGIKTFSDSGVK